MKWRSIVVSGRRAVRGVAASRSRRGWVLQVIPLGVLVALLIGRGPFLQDHVFRVVGSDAPSVYDAVHKNGVTRFPTLSEWFEFATYPRFLLIGLLTAHLALLRKRLWSVISAFAVWTAVLLTALDMAFIIAGAEEAPDLLTAIVGNALGGALVAIIIGFVLPLYKWLPRAFPDAQKAAPATAATSALLIGVGLSALTFYFLELFFQPTPVEFAAVFEPPIKAFVGSTAKEKREVINFMPDGPTEAELTANSPGSQLQLDWAASKQSNGYSLTARLLTSCMQTDLDKINMSSGGPVWTNVKRVSLSFDEGFTLLRTASKEATRYSFERRTPSNLWLDWVDKIAVKATYYIDPEDRLAATTSDERRVLFGAILMRTQDKKAFIRPRRLSLTIDGKSLWLDLRYSPTSGRGGVCRDVPLPATLTSGSLSVPSLMIAVLLTFTPTELESAPYDSAASKLTIKGGNGWLSVAPIPIGDLTSSDIGGTDFVGIAANPMFVELDGQRIEANAFDQFVAFGDVDATVLGGAKVKLAGTTERLWRGRHRLNPTKWERLSGEAKLAALTAIITLLGLLFRLVWWPAMRDLRDEDVNAWV